MRTLRAALALSLSAPAWALPVCERTPQVRLAIANAAGWLDCDNEKGLSGITRLNLADAAMDSLKAGDFDGLPSLEWLDLEGKRFIHATRPKRLLDLPRPGPLRRLRIALCALRPRK